MEFKLEPTEFDGWYVKGYNLCDVGIIWSPFANCQTFSVRSAKEFTYLDDSNIKELLYEICSKTGKRQMIVDLNDEYVESFKKKVEPYSLNIYELPYVSTNNSEMQIMIVQIDEDKIST